MDWASTNQLCPPPSLTTSTRWPCSLRLQVIDPDSLVVRLCIQPPLHPQPLLRQALRRSDASYHHSRQAARSNSTGNGRLRRAVVIRLRAGLCLPMQAPEPVEGYQQSMYRPSMCSQLSSSTSPTSPLTLYQAAFWNSYGALNLITEAALLILPLVIVWNIQTQRKKKAIIVSCFASRIVYVGQYHRFA